MLVHPNFDPILVSIGPIAVRWYGLMYLVGFVFAWVLAKRRIAMGNTFFTQKSFEDFLFLAILGVVLGGRLGYILFYMPDYYLQNPLKVFAVTEGGMSFHGGLLGVLTAIAFTAWKHKRRFLEVGDFVAPLVPLGLGFGRIGNFINGELWGRPTDGPWGMIFPHAGDGVARHPSQLYEATLEGFVLFALLWWFTAKPRPVGQASAIFLVGYGVARFVSEFAREPDSFLGLLAGHLSMGQWLSMPMIIIGVLMWIWSRRQPISQR